MHSVNLTCMFYGLPAENYQLLFSLYIHISILYNMRVDPCLEITCTRKYELFDRDNTLKTRKARVTSKTLNFYFFVMFNHSTYLLFPERDFIFFKIYFTSFWLLPIT